MHSAYEEIVRFASEGPLAEELQRAKAEFIQRTGDLFESDDSFERRIAAFLEWYALDRPVAAQGNRTPAQLYLADRGENAKEIARLEPFTRTTLSLFEFRRAKGEGLVVTDLLTNEKHQVFERRKPAGLESGDVLEARLVPYEDKLVFSEAVNVLPREPRRRILKVARRFRSGKAPVVDRIDLVHRVAYFGNRCERYKHVAPTQIFADLEHAVFTGELPGRGSMSAG